MINIVNQNYFVYSTDWTAKWTPSAVDWSKFGIPRDSLSIINDLSDPRVDWIYLQTSIG